MDKQRDEAACCMGCRQAYHLLCPRKMCRSCCEGRASTRGCIIHSSEASKQLHESKKRHRLKKITRRIEQKARQALGDAAAPTGQEAHADHMQE